MVPVIAIFDIGKTNKKVILYDEHYKVIHEQTKQFDQVQDENGNLCDNIEAIKDWVNNTINFLALLSNISLKGFNVSAYGASFVHLDKDRRILTPLYNYLEPYPELLLKKFYETYGEEVELSTEMASPALGNLNSGLQLFRIKHERPALFDKIRYSLHLPQYISSIISSQLCSDITSIGCHTYLWNFRKKQYHDWVFLEGIDKKFPPIKKSNSVIIAGDKKKNSVVGVGLHDSSAALIPYLTSFKVPFLLLSTGTWCITLNPFNNAPLTANELKKDCLCYLSFTGEPLKASRLFAGNEHEVQTKRLADHFKKEKHYYQIITFDPTIYKRLKNSNMNYPPFTGGLQNSLFEKRELFLFSSYEEAYHQLMIDIMELQRDSILLVLQNSTQKIFVDGGFSRNDVFMNLLSLAFPNLDVFGATVAQSTALGAALAIHQHWNSQPIPDDLVELKCYSPAQIRQESGLP